MTRGVALFIALVFTAGLGELPTAWAQSKDASKKQAPVSTETTAADPNAASPKAASSKKVRLEDRLDINTASLAELQSLPGVDAALAKRIVENRPYQWKDQLVRKKIVPQDTYEMILKLVTVKKAAAPNAAAPRKARVDLNKASLAELQSLPGMNADHAQKIVKNRPYNRKVELLELKIIPESLYDMIRDGILVERGVNLNTASLAELRSLPGVTAGYAKKIVDNRPYRKKIELVEKQVIPQDLYEAIEYDISTKVRK
jgi:DNA uptake protein ComE-like DNA-binding protein